MHVIPPRRHPRSPGHDRPCSQRTPSSSRCIRGGTDTGRLRGERPLTACGRGSESCGEAADTHGSNQDHTTLRATKGSRSSRRTLAGMPEQCRRGPASILPASVRHRLVARRATTPLVETQPLVRRGAQLRSHRARTTNCPTRGGCRPGDLAEGSAATRPLRRSRRGTFGPEGPARAQGCSIEDAPIGKGARYVWPYRKLGGRTRFPGAHERMHSTTLGRTLRFSTCRTRFPDASGACPKVSRPTPV